MSRGIEAMVDDFDDCKQTQIEVISIKNPEIYAPWIGANFG